MLKTFALLVHSKKPLFDHEVLLGENVPLYLWIKVIFQLTLRVEELKIKLSLIELDSKRILWRETRFVLDRATLNQVITTNVSTIHTSIWLPLQLQIRNKIMQDKNNIDFFFWSRKCCVLWVCSKCQTDARCYRHSSIMQKFHC